MSAILNRLDISLVRAYLQGKCLSDERGISLLHPEALVMGILTTTPNEVSALLEMANVDIGSVIRFCDANLKLRMGRDRGVSPSCLVNGVTNEIKTALELAERSRCKEAAAVITMEHLLPALIATSKTVESIFAQQGITAASIWNHFGLMPVANTIPVQESAPGHPFIFHVTDGNACWCWRQRFGPPNTPSTDH